MYNYVCTVLLMNIGCLLYRFSASKVVWGLLIWEVAVAFLGTKCYSSPSNWVASKICFPQKDHTLIFNNDQA